MGMWGGEAVGGVSLSSQSSLHTTLPTVPHLKIDLVHDAGDVVDALDVPGGRIAAHVPPVDRRVGQKIRGRERQLCARSE